MLSPRPFRIEASSRISGVASLTCFGYSCPHLQDPLCSPLSSFCVCICHTSLCEKSEFEAHPVAQYRRSRRLTVGYVVPPAQLRRRQRQFPALPASEFLFRHLIDTVVAPSQRLSKRWKWHDDYPIRHFQRLWNLWKRRIGITLLVEFERRRQLVSIVADHLRWHQLWIRRSDTAQSEHFSQSRAVCVLRQLRRPLIFPIVAILSVITRLLWADPLFEWQQRNQQQQPVHQSLHTVGVHKLQKLGFAVPVKSATVDSLLAVWQRKKRRLRRIRCNVAPRSMFLFVCGVLLRCVGDVMAD